MAVPQLPQLILTEIIHQYLLDSTLVQGLRLRNVSRYFDEEVLRALFVLQIKNLRDVVKWKRVHPRFSLLQIQGFFGKRTVQVEEHRVARKAILRVAGFDPYDPLNNTCFSYRPGQQCLTTAVGSSRAQCKAHDLMNAMICAIGAYEVFVYGLDQDEGYTGAAPKDIRYWSLLLACYRNEPDQVREQLHELRNDPAFEGKYASTACDCFMVATRKNYPSLINILHEEMENREDIHEKLGKRSSEFNVLVEAIRLNHDDVFEALLKWKWKFNHDTWTYTRFMNYILDHKMEETQRYSLFELMLTWTDVWRNISVMKTLLQNIGKKNDIRLMEILVRTLKTQHFFRHERGVEGDFPDSAPLDEFCRTVSKPELLRMFLKYRRLMLPHTTDEQEMEMRRLALRTELLCQPRIDLTRLRILVEYSEDLIKERSKLHSILCRMPMGEGGNIKDWGWLAKRVGLKSFCVDSRTGKEGIFGSVLLAHAVEKLDVDAVTYLVDQDCRLTREAATFQVYEDDSQMMARLVTVREQLARGGQGDYKERKVFETTFMPIKRIVPKYALYSHVAKSKKADTNSAPAAIEAARAATETQTPSPTCPRFLRSISSSAQKKTPKKRKSTSNTTAINTSSRSPS